MELYLILAALAAVVICLVLLLQQNSRLRRMDDLEQQILQLQSLLQEGQKGDAALQARQDLLMHSVDGALEKLQARQAESALLTEQKLDQMRRSLTESLDRMQGASQQQLVTMLFDGVLSALVRARLFMQDNNQQGKGVSLSKAINIIENGLRVSLDEESKDELTQNLIALYSYMVRRLLQANLRNDVSAVEEVETLMRNIADAWKELLLSPSLIQDPV